MDILVHAMEGCSLFDIVGFELDASELLNGKKVDLVDDMAIVPQLAPYILAEATIL